MAWSRLARWRTFEDQQEFLRLCAWVLGTVALIKGLRLPNLWSATQAQIDYRFGFVKRGLFGQVLTRSLHLEHYGRFAAFSLIVLAVAVLLFVLLVRQSGILQRVANGLPVVVFVSSLAVTNLTNIIGYLDVLQLAGTLALLLVRNTILRFFLGLVLCVTCLLVHESFLFQFLPAILFSFFVDWAEGRASFRQAAVFVGAIVVLSGVGVILIAGHRSLSPEDLALLKTQVAASSDFPVRLDYFDVMARSAKDNLRIMLEVARQIRYPLWQLSGLIALGPVFAFLLVCMRRFANGSTNVAIRSYGFVAAVLASCAPLLLNFLGWDVIRWDSSACVSAFLVLLLLVRAFPQQTLSFDLPAIRVAALIVALSMASGEALLDIDRVNPYPFFVDGFRSIYHLHLGGNRLTYPVYKDRMTP